MRLKDDSVSLVGVCPQIVFALAVATRIYEAHGVELVITSCNDATHSETSLHYDGRAVDLRTRNLEPDSSHPYRRPAPVAREIGERLGRDFDVVLESDHIHLEWQPRRRSA